jgi:hypothetical protein
VILASESPVSGVAHQLRGIPVDLVEVGAIWRNPAIARAATHGSIDRSEGAIASNLRACWILRDTELGAVNPAAADVAVTEFVVNTKRSSGETASQHSSEGLPALVSIFTSGPMLILPSSSMVPMAHPSPTACHRGAILGR